LQKGVAAHEGFSPAIADCGRQGTATSPPSTTSSSLVQNTAAFGPARKPVLKRAIAFAADIIQIFGRLWEPPDLWRRGWDSNPRYPFEVHTLSRRADSTSSRTSPCGSIHPDYRHFWVARFWGWRRRERDSNPRGTFWAPNRFRVDRLRPLGHPSLPASTIGPSPCQRAGSGSGLLAAATPATAARTPS
jgi:hypothetical protein